MFSMMKPKRKSHSTGTDIGGSSEQCMLEKMIKKNTALDFFKSFWFVQNNGATKYEPERQKIFYITKTFFS